MTPDEVVAYLADEAERKATEHAQWREANPDLAAAEDKEKRAEAVRQAERAEVAKARKIAADKAEEKTWDKIIKDYKRRDRFARRSDKAAKPPGKRGPRYKTFKPEPVFDAGIVDGIVEAAGGDLLAAHRLVHSHIMGMIARDENPCTLLESPEGLIKRIKGLIVRRIARDRPILAAMMAIRKKGRSDSN